MRPSSLPMPAGVARRAVEAPAAPLVWRFDGTFDACLTDAEDTLRRAIVQIGDAARIVVLIELSLPTLQRRVIAGDAIQPAWGRFIDRISNGYGLPGAPWVRYRPAVGPLATLVVAYRS